MLPAAARLHTRHDHRLVAQAGCRVRRGDVVIVLATPREIASRDPARGDARSRATVIAGRRVGSAVARNRVKRRLRELVRTRLTALPPGSMLVVRALPGAAAAPYGQLGAWVDGGIGTCVDRARRRASDD